MEERVTGIVLTQTDSKENDILIGVATSFGIINLFAKGVKKVDAKNKAACQLFSQSEFTVSYPNEQSRGVITGASVIKDYKISSNLEAIAMLSVVSEIHTRYFPQLDMYQAITDLLMSCSSMNSPWLDFCWLIKLWIEASGISPQVDHCHNCDEPLIVALSLSGGFTCRNCYQNYDLHFTKEQLLLFRYLFKAKIQDKPKIRELTYNWSIAKMLMDYYLYHQPAEVKSWQFLCQLSTMSSDYQE